MAVARALTYGAVAVRANERLLGALALLLGGLLFYVVMLDQGTLVALFSAAGINYLHEFFHDGRHLGGAPCH